MVFPLPSSSILLTYFVYVSLFNLLYSSPFLLFFIFNPSFPNSLFSSLIQLLPHFLSSLAIDLLLSSILLPFIQLLNFIYTAFYFGLSFFYYYFILQQLTDTVPPFHGYSMAQL